LTKKTKKFNIKKIIEDADDEECLSMFSEFFERLDIGAKFVEDQEGLITHQFLVVRCGEKVLVSDPDEFDWPLQRLPMPDALQGLIN
jgi:hypothetical protein